MNEQTAPTTEEAVVNPFVTYDESGNAVFDDESAKAVTRKRYMALGTDKGSIDHRVEAAILAAQNFYKVPVQFNLRDGVELPEGYTTAILPISTHDESIGKHVMQRLCILAIPSVELLQSDAQGARLVTTAVSDALLKQCTAAVKKDDVMPLVMAEFTTQRGQDAEAWRALRTQYLKLIRDNGLARIDAMTFETCLRSHSYAQSTGYAEVTAEQWAYILERMIAHGKAKGLNTLCMEQWLTTRMETDLDVGKLDLSGLAAFGFDDESTVDDGTPEAEAATA